MVSKSAKSKIAKSLISVAIILSIALVGFLVLQSYAISAAFTTGPVIAATSVNMTTTKTATNDTNQNISVISDLVYGAGSAVTYVYTWYDCGAGGSSTCKTGTINATTFFPTGKLTSATCLVEDVDPGAVLYLPLNNDTLDYSGTLNGSVLFVNDSLVIPVFNESGGIDADVEIAARTASGKVGGAYTFNGVNQSITISVNLSTVNATFDFANGSEGEGLSNQTWTWMAWIKRDTLTNASFDPIISKGRSGNLGEASGFVITLGDVANVTGNNSNLNFSAYGDNQSVSATAPILAGEWTHIAVTYENTTLGDLDNGGGGNVTLYINGQQSGSGIIASISNNSGSGASDYLIGSAFANGTFQYFDGTIDEVQIYNASLYALQIEQIYMGSVGGGHTLNSSYTYRGHNYTASVRGLTFNESGAEVNASGPDDMNISAWFFPFPYIVAINSTYYDTNDTYGNLTATVAVQTDGNDENYTLVYNWYYLNSVSPAAHTSTINATTFFPTGELTSATCLIEDVDPGAVLYLPLDYNTLDYSGTLNNSALYVNDSMMHPVFNTTAGIDSDAETAAKTTAGVVRGAYTFNGTSDFINVSNIASNVNLTFDFNNGSEGGLANDTWTWMAWVKVDVLTQLNPIISKGAQGEIGAGGFAIIIGNSTNVSASPDVDNSDFANVTFLAFAENDTIQGSTPIEVGNWTHIAVTYANGTLGDKDYGGGGNVTIYINGQQSGSGIIASITNDSGEIAGHDYLIGAVSANGTYQYFDGTIDEVQIYNASLYALQIEQIYMGSVGGGDSLNSSFITGGENYTLSVRALGFDQGLLGIERYREVNITSTMVDGLNVTSDTTAPLIYLDDSPAAALSTTTSGYNFTFNVTDHAKVQNCTLLFNDSVISYMSLSTNGENETVGIYYDIAGSGNYTWSINCTDENNNAGGSSTVRVLTITDSTTTGTVSGGGTSAVTATGTTYKPSDEQLTTGYTKEMKVRDVVSVRISGKTHSVKVSSIESNKATIVISSEPITLTLAVRDTRKADVNGDGMYDLSVKLNKIEGSKADVTVRYITEEVTAESEAEEAEKEAEAAGEGGEGGGGTWWMWLIGIIVVIVIIAAIVMKKKK